MEKLKELFNHERYQMIAIIACVVFLFWLFGCESEVFSVQNPDQKLCRAELEAELGFVLASYEKRFRELIKCDA